MIYINGEYSSIANIISVSPFYFIEIIPPFFFLLDNHLFERGCGITAIVSLLMLCVIIFIYYSYLSLGIGKREYYPRIFSMS